MQHEQNIKGNEISTNRLEAFSDGVIAIIITIMVLEIKVPHDPDIYSWLPLVPVILAYILSFMVLAIYWNNHHHLLKATKNISTAVMWNNMHLLFWLSIVPVATAWMGENYNEKWPVIIYSLVGFMSGLAYFFLSQAIIKANPNSEISKALKEDKKGLTTQIILLLSLIFAFWYPAISYGLIVLTAIIWFIPDKRLAKIL